MTETLCLQWNDYKENTISAFGNLREEKDLNDVTLACEDGQQVEAHKVILAASSPFFQKLFGRNKHPHPLVYMRGMKIDDLIAVVDFLYRGEANVAQENLDSFLAIAEELQLRGLVGKIDERTEEFDAGGKYPPSKVLPSPHSETIQAHPQAERQGNKIVTAEGNTVALPNFHPGELDQLEEMVKSMMEKSQSMLPHRPGIVAYICKVCGKQGQWNAIKDHIEANHIEGIVIPCNLCDRTFRSRNALRYHNRYQQFSLFGQICKLIFRSRSVLRHDNRQ